MNGNLEYLPSRVWLMSLCSVSQVPATLQHIPIRPLFLFMAIVCIGHALFIHLSAGGHLGHFHSWRLQIKLLGTFVLVTA